MKRLTKWLRKTRKHVEQFHDFIDDWLQLDQEVKDDTYFWAPFEDKKMFRTLNLIINIDCLRTQPSSCSRTWTSLVKTWR